MFGIHGLELFTWFTFDSFALEQYLKAEATNPRHGSTTSSTRGPRSLIAILPTPEVFMKDNELKPYTDPTMERVPQNECDMRQEQLSLSLTDKAATAFAWAVSLAALFAAAAAVLIAFFRREKGR
jgi:hypothetical protein